MRLLICDVAFSLVMYVLYILRWYVAAEEDDFSEGLILPPLVIQLRKILDQYSDETQIFKVSVLM